MNCKKITLTLLSAMVLFSFTACQSKDRTKGTDNNSSKPAVNVTINDKDTDKTNNDSESSSSSFTVHLIKSKASASKKATTRVKNDEATLYELGKNQTQEIKSILTENISLLASDSSKFAMYKDSPDENRNPTKGYECFITNSTGNEGLYPDNEKDHKYGLEYKNRADSKNEDQENYRYTVIIDFPASKQFKIEDFKVLKNLIKVTDKNYDFSDFDKWYQEAFELSQKNTKDVIARNRGNYLEQLKTGIEDNDKSMRFITYTANYGEGI